MARAGADAVVAFDEGSQPPSSDGVEWVPVRHIDTEGSSFLRISRMSFAGQTCSCSTQAGPLPNARAAAATRRLGIPYLLEPRGAYYPHIVNRKRLFKRAWWSAMERRLVSGSRAIHGFFEQERSHLAALGYRGPVVVASNGVDLPEGPTWDGGSGGYLLWLGRFDPQHKGLDLLLQALRLVPTAERPLLRLHGPDWRGRKRKVAALIKGLGLETWAVIGEPAYGDAKRKLLRRAKGFVYPFRWDACPNSVLEAVSLGIPTVGTSYPLACMLAEHGGALVGEADAQGLADGIRNLLSAGSEKMGRTGARVVRDGLSWDQVGRSWLSQMEPLQ